MLLDYGPTLDVVKTTQDAIDQNAEMKPIKRITVFDLKDTRIGNLYQSNNIFYFKSYSNG